MLKKSQTTEADVVFQALSKFFSSINNMYSVLEISVIQIIKIVLMSFQEKIVRKLMELMNLKSHYQSRAIERAFYLRFGLHCRRDCVLPHKLKNIEWLKR